LDKTIASKRVAEVELSKTVRVPGVPENYGDPDVDQNFGGGATVPQPGGNTKTTISGNSNTKVKDVDGRPLPYGPEDILMHEFTGHVFRRIIGEGNGDAIDEENEAREEMNLPLREFESNPPHPR